MLQSYVCDIKKECRQYGTIETNNGLEIKKEKKMDLQFRLGTVDDAAMMRELCRIAVSRGYKKVEWHCLEWNEPANELYLKLNATQKRDWIFYRLFGETLEELGKR